MIPTLNTIEIRIGSDVTLPFRWAQPSLTYRAVTEASQAAPCVVTVLGHGLPEGWPFLLTGAAGMPEILAVYPSRPHFAHVLSADSLELNLVNTVNAAPYTGGGTIAYRPPMDLTGMTLAADLEWLKGESNKVDLVATVSPDGSVIEVAIAHDTALVPGGTRLSVWATDSLGKRHPVGTLLVEFLA